jgi:hypothetical protein
MNDMQELVYETIIHWEEGGGKRSRRELARRIVDLYAEQAEKQEPDGWITAGKHTAPLRIYPLQQEKQEPVGFMNAGHVYEMQQGRLPYGYVYPESGTGADVAVYTAPPQRQPLTTREVELLDGMIEVQLRHAKQCDGIGNRTMAEKQKGWDMERVALLQKLKAAHGIGGGE